VPASATPDPTARPLLPRQELFAFHAARGASLAQASQLAGYSHQGARQRGSVLMANSDVRLRVEEFRRDWMAERDATVAEAVEETGQVIETALRLNRPTAALKAIELKLKLRGIIHDRRFSLYTDSPDDDLSTCLFDPREDEDPPLEPPAQSPEPPAEAAAIAAQAPEAPAIVPPKAAPSVAAAPAPHPQPRKPQLSAVRTGTAPAALPTPAGPAPVLRIPPVPPRVLEAFNIDGKGFPTVCPASPENPGSP
jgi:phage terminase small subunit